MYFLMNSFGNDQTKLSMKLSYKGAVAVKGLDYREGKCLRNQWEI